MRIVALAVVITPMLARAEGERGPMIGASLVATRASDNRELGGVAAELVMWRSRFGLGIEASRQAGLDGTGGALTTVGGSARLLLYRELMPSLLDARDTVELGLEAHGIVEREWWGAERDVSYGGALVIRLRGDTDFTNVLAESRLMIRVVSSPAAPMPTSIARTTMPASPHELTLVIGIGAVFGRGEPAYAKQFRPRLLDANVP